MTNGRRSWKRGRKRRFKRVSIKGKILLFVIKKLIGRVEELIKVYVFVYLIKVSFSDSYVMSYKYVILE